MRSGLLPPGLTEAAFAAALDAFRAALGGESVVTSTDGLAAYLDPFAPGDARQYAASAALLPASVDEIRALLEIANRFRIPLWTVSTGRNFAYGGASPRIAGSAVLDLKRMNRIIEVNETLSYALVEPGVSYFDLHQYLLAHDCALWVDPPAAG